MPSLEIACFNPSSALTAALNGADRIELCRDYVEGGLTPYESDLAILQYLFATSSTTITGDTNALVRPPIMIMIRPQPYTFVYSNEELADMVHAIKAFNKNEAVTGYVFGALTSKGKVDKEANKMLIKVANGRPCTFHRAFDEIIGSNSEGSATSSLADDVKQALEDVIACGFSSLLTSGRGSGAAEASLSGDPSAKQDEPASSLPGLSSGARTIALLQELAGSRLSVIPGGGVRSSNVIELLKTTHTEWVHSSAILREVYNEHGTHSANANGKEVRLLKDALSRLE